MAKRRTEITVETERLVLAHSRRTTRIFCARCGLEVEADETTGGPAPGEAEQPEEAEDSHHS